MALDPQSLDLLIRTIYGEAASEPPEGQAGVAAVILNRARQGDRYGGSTVRDVVMAPKQFEPWGNPSARERMMALDPSSERYQTLARIAEGVAGGDIPDPTGGATHFANEAIVRQRRGGNVAPWMAEMADTARTIGNHTFYGGGGGNVHPSGLPPAGQRPGAMPAPPEWAQQYKSGPMPKPPAWAQQFQSGAPPMGMAPPPTPTAVASGAPMQLAPGASDTPAAGSGVAGLMSALGAMGGMGGESSAPQAPQIAPMQPGQDLLGPLLAQRMAMLMGRA